MENLLWIAAIPAVVTIILTTWTKKLFPSLLIGLITGGMLKSQSIFNGLPTTIEYIVNSLSNKGNLEVLIFLYLFSGLVGLIKKSGGIKAFTSLSEKHIKNERAVLYTIWGIVPLTFIDCGFRVVATGSIIKSLAKKYEVAKERLAFMINNTASPIVVLIPVATTFVGYNIGVINQGLNAAGQDGVSGYTILLESIPLQFFSIVAIIITFAGIYFDIEKKGFYKPHKEDEKEKEDDMEMMNMGDEESRIKPRLINIIIPMVLVIALSFIILLVYGLQVSENHSGIGAIMEAIEPTSAMLLALFTTIIVTGIIFLVQGYPLGDMTQDLISGGNEIMDTIAILVLAWPLSDISLELGLPEFIENTLGGSLPKVLVPVSIYIATCLVAYFIGTSWGTWALVMPVAIPLAVSTGTSIPIAVAAVLSGGTFGDVTSPISGMTVMASNISNANHMKYIKYASYYNIAAGIIAAALFVIVPWIVY